MKEKQQQQQKTEHFFSRMLLGSFFVQPSVLPGKINEKGLSHVSVQIQCTKLFSCKCLLIFFFFWCVFFIEWNIKLMLFAAFATHWLDVVAVWLAPFVFVDEIIMLIVLLLVVYFNMKTHKLCPDLIDMCWKFAFDFHQQQKYKLYLSLRVFYCVQWPNYLCSAINLSIVEKCDWKCLALAYDTQTFLSCNTTNCIWL